MWDNDSPFIYEQHNQISYSNGSLASSIEGSCSSPETTLFAMGVRTKSDQREFHVTCDTGFTQAGTTNIISFASSNFASYPTLNMIAYEDTIWSSGIKSLGGNSILMI